MTKNWPRLTVVTLFILLAFTASASAECAWVLWSTYHPRRERAIERAFESQRACEQAIPEAVQ